MSRRDRIRLKTELIAQLSIPEWSWDRINVLLHEFDAGRLIDDQFAGSIADTVTDLPDAALLEMYAIVADVEIDEVEGEVAAAAEDGNWKRGYVRLFLSHSAHHREFAGQVASELAVVGIHGFVAHDTMEYSLPWQTQIEQALRTMQLFAALIHPEFNQSPGVKKRSAGRSVAVFPITSSGWAQTPRGSSRGTNGRVAHPSPRRTSRTRSQHGSSACPSSATQCSTACSRHSERQSTTWMQAPPRNVSSRSAA